MNLSEKCGYGLATGIVLVALNQLGLNNYLLFHSIAELFSIFIAIGIFVIAWETRRISKGSFLLFLGIAFLFIGIIDLLHMFSYKGMGLFPTTSANLSTQFWIVARYLQAVSLLIAVFLVDRQIRAIPVVIAYALVLAAIIYSIQNDLFPVAFVDGVGLTTFKIASEYLISLFLAITMYSIWQKKSFFEQRLFQLLIWSIFVTIVSEMAFTLYVDVYGLFNKIGHFLKVIAYYLIYAAIVRANFRKPYQELQVEIGKSKKAEEALRDNETFLASLIENIPSMVFVKDAGELRYIRINRAGEKLLGIERSELYGKNDYDLFAQDEADFFAQKDKETLVSGRMLDITEETVQTRDKEQRILHTMKIPIMDDNGVPLYLLGLSEDITERKEAEAELHRYRANLEELVKERTEELEGKNRKLESMNQLFVDREFRIKELKNRVVELEKRLGTEDGKL